jgi:hypothetical protein
MRTSSGTEYQHDNGARVKAWVDEHGHVNVHFESQPYGPANPTHGGSFSMTYDEYQALECVMGQERHAIASDVKEVDMVANRPAGAIEINHGYSLLVPWDADKDRRPRTKTSRVGDPTYAKWLAGGGRLPSANHGECTPCAKANKLSTATHRQVNARTGSTEISLCAEHVRIATKAPIEVPTFSSAEEAQEWLDRQTDLLEGTG